MIFQATAITQSIALLKEHSLHLLNISTTFPGGHPVTDLHIILAEGV